MTDLIQAQNLSKSYGSTPVLNRISLTVAEGEFLAIMGASGSGKSTLLNVLSTLDDADSGALTLMGQPVERLSAEQKAELRRQKMGFVFQDAIFLPQLTLLDNIILAADEGAKERPRLVERAQMLMTQMGIGELGDRSITAVSGGQLQRASICRAMLHEPPLLFADEPTGSLNSASTIETMKLFASIHQAGTTLILVTHDPQVASYASRVVYMRDGEWVRATTFDDADPASKVQQIQRDMQALQL